MWKCAILGENVIQALCDSPYSTHTHTYTLQHVEKHDTCEMLNMTMQEADGRWKMVQQNAISSRLEVENVHVVSVQTVATLTAFSVEESWHINIWHGDGLEFYALPFFLSIPSKHTKGRERERVIERERESENEENLITQCDSIWVSWMNRGWIFFLSYNFGQTLSVDRSVWCTSHFSKREKDI